MILLVEGVEGSGGDGRGRKEGRGCREGRKGCEGGGVRGKERQ